MVFGKTANIYSSLIECNKISINSFKRANIVLVVAIIHRTSFMFLVKERT